MHFFWMLLWLKGHKEFKPSEQFINFLLRYFYIFFFYYLKLLSARQDGHGLHFYRLSCHQHQCSLLSPAFFYPFFSFLLAKYTVKTVLFFTFFHLFLLSTPRHGNHRVYFRTWITVFLSFSPFPDRDGWQRCLSLCNPELSD